MHSPSHMRRIVLEELVRRLKHATGRPLLDAARAAIAHGESVEVFSVEQRRRVEVLATPDDVARFEDGLRAQITTDAERAPRLFRGTARTRSDRTADISDRGRR